MAIIRHLIVDQYGAFVGKHSGRLRVTRQKDGQTEKLAEAPLIHLDGVVVTGRGVSFSADAVEACSRDGIPIHFLDSRGRPYAALYSAGLTGTVLTRREQLLAYADRRGLALAKAFASGKIQNQAGFLRYAAKYRKETNAELYRALQEGANAVAAHLDEMERLDAPCVDQIRFEILAAEGRAAQRYWAALKQVLPESYGWPGRRTRGAADPVNNALNYGYGILYGAVERALVLAGLDPYGGFIHADRPGKPSLVFDLIEEFRQVVVDRTVFGLANKGVALDLDDKGLLVEKARRTLAEKVLARLEAAERYERKRQPLRAILQSQARHVATYVRGDRIRYRPFVARW
jgi:CRISPR-associated protein Cas1